MKTRFQNAIEDKAKHVSEIYNVSENVAIIIMLTGISIYQDDQMKNRP